MYRIACCDDEPIFLEHITRITADVMRRRRLIYSLSTFRTSRDLLAAFEAGGYSTFDLLLLDILLENGENGVETARCIRSLHSEVPIIFISCSAEFALAGYDVHPIHYLLKPVDPQRLEEAIGLALSRAARSPTLTVRSREMQRTLSVNTIRYIEVFNYRILIHTTGDTVECTGHLSNLMDKLPAEQFLRCHKSYLVNLEFVTGIRRYELELGGKQLLPVSKQNYRDIQLAFLHYCERCLPPM